MEEEGTAGARMGENKQARETYRKTEETETCG